jgi:Rps23 Pro-64 3,4-dihydroxylase Tpa1-like proline 4-hydroxylase
MIETHILAMRDYRYKLSFSYFWQIKIALKMERIVIEVDERIAKAWRRASDKKRRDIGNKVNLSLAKELMGPPAERKGKAVNEYLSFLNELRDDMLAKGLTQEEMDEILNDE